jgi:FkbM family methyltransferase
MNLKAIKKASLSIGLYRPVRSLYRFLDKSEMDAYVCDRRLYAQLLPQGRALCFDVGANIGRITEVLLELGHKVIAFEPQSECVKEIKARCTPYKHSLQIEETALGDARGGVTMFVRESAGQSSLRSTWEGVVTDTIQVQVSTLDLAIHKFGIPAYCKIDVEGWELQVLLGLSQPIHLVSFEYHQNDGKMKDAYACLDRLCSLAQIELNLTAREQSQLVLDDWVDADEFKAVFQRRFHGRDQFVYGDIYVRMLGVSPNLSAT